MRLPLRLLLILALLLPPSPATALDLDITSGQWRPSQIAVEPFAGQDALPGQPFAQIIADDLHRSGAFTPRHLSAPGAETLPQSRKAGAEYLLSGAVQVARDRSGFTASFTLTDAITEEKIGNIQTTQPARLESARTVAHQMANWIYEKITKNPGVFHTKIAYILRRPDPKADTESESDTEAEAEADSETDIVNELRVADYDGHNPMTALSSPYPLISPRFTPDGDALLYVAIEPVYDPQYPRQPISKTRIYWQSLITGERRLLANFRGNNTAPAMSPDQQMIAAALTPQGGEFQIYTLDFPDIGAPDRLRKRESPGGASTEPIFSPDGTRLAFVSDEGGGPQIYEHSFATGKSRRVTYRGRNNTEPAYFSSGNGILFVHRDKNGYNIAVLDLESGQIAPLTAVNRADSPSLSPNDQIALFRDGNEKNVLYTVSINGRIKVRWRKTETGEIVDPTWGPAESTWY